MSSCLDPLIEIDDIPPREADSEANTDSTDFAELPDRSENTRLADDEQDVLAADVNDAASVRNGSTVAVPDVKPENKVVHIGHQT